MKEKKYVFDFKNGEINSSLFVFKFFQIFDSKINLIQFFLKMDEKETSSFYLQKNSSILFLRFFLRRHNLS